MKAIITVDLGFGDGGKGTIVDALVRRYNAPLVVRYSGGSQCAHTVYSGRLRHTFAQFGATFYPAYTLCSRYMLVNPLTMMHEAEVLEMKGCSGALDRTFIDGRALMVTPFHRAVNRLKELGRAKHGKRHGSCGHGIGETVADDLLNPGEGLRMADMKTKEFGGKMAAVKSRMAHIANTLPDLPDCEETHRQLSTFSYDMKKLFERYYLFYRAMAERIVTEEQVSDMLTVTPVVVFEGAQGVLLDENFGFYPYNTWTTTTMKNALLMLEEAELRVKPTTIGIIRSYMTRHGAGPFPTENQEMTRLLEDKNNPFNTWQEMLRSGPLDMPLLRYSLAVNGPVDCLAITHMDRVREMWPICETYEAGEVPIPTTLKQAEEVGCWLATPNVKPVIRPIPRSEFCSTVAMNLSTSIGITSYTPGPNKEFHDESLKIEVDSP